MKKLLVLAALLVAYSVTAQQVNPGGGVYAMSDVPGLTNALGETVTNAYTGAETGTTSGEVSKVGRQLELRFPTLPDYPGLETNWVFGFVNIDPTGTTVVDFAHTFTNVPFLTLVPADEDIEQLVSPLILDITESNATFIVLSSGAVVTNEYRIAWQANGGAGLAWIGDSLDGLGGGTNIYLNNGTQPMNNFYFPVSHGAGKWLACDASGYGFWQDRTIANLTDGASVFKKDGTVLPTANWNMNGKRVLNMTRLQVTDGAAAGRYLGCDATGIGYWMPLPSWSPAGSHLNMNGYQINGVGSMFVGGLATLSTLYMSGTATFKWLVNMDYKVTLSATAPLEAKGTALFSATGGSYGAPKVWSKGYTRVDGTLDARGAVYAYNGLAAYGNLTAYPGVAFWASGGHAVCDRDVVCGDYSWITANYPALSSPWGNIIAQRGFYGATLAISGSKTFRIEHPKDKNKYLFHASAESPKPELLYRGKTTLVSGKATVNLNTYYELIPETLDAMLTNLTVNVYNNQGWTKVRCAAINSSVEFEIEAESTDCNDTVEWVAIATRCDEGVSNYQIEESK